jgi:hypothetical protein
MIPELRLVTTILVVVWLVLYKAPVVKLVVIRPVPDTSSVAPGLVVLIPTVLEPAVP